MSIVVNRGWGDWRKIVVPEEALSGFHLADFAGGTHSRLPRTCLAAYMSCDVIPDDTDFGHSCTHGPAPLRIKVLIHEAGNEKSYARLQALARNQETA